MKCKKKNSGSAMTKLHDVCLACVPLLPFRISCFVANLSPECRFEKSLFSRRATKKLSSKSPNILDYNCDAFKFSILFSRKALTWPPLSSVADSIVAEAKQNKLFFAEIAVRVFLLGKATVASLHLHSLQPRVELESFLMSYCFLHDANCKCTE